MFTKHRSGLCVALVVLLVPLMSACAPSPEELCQHTMEIMKKEVGAELPEGADKECIEGAEKTKKKLDRKGPTAYRDFAKCVMAADSAESLGKCE